MEKKMKTSELVMRVQNLAKARRMPVLFIGHGNPMNAIEDNEFTPQLASNFENIAQTGSDPMYLRSLGGHGERQ
jgi:4,5-DOPA dioxygenase extradiol